MISLDDVVLRGDLDPRLGQRDEDLIAQYADIFDALPPIEINQDNVLVDGWHRILAARRIERTEIAYVVVETNNDEDLGDKMWAANLKHGVQYTRVQRQTQGLKLHVRKLTPKEIANQVGVSTATVRRWTKGLREEDRRIRDERILSLAEGGMSLRKIADEVGVDHKTVAGILGKNAQMRETPHEEAASESPGIVDVEPEETADDVEEPEPSLDTDEAPNEETRESEAGQEAAPVDEIPESELEPASLEPIPDDILNTARDVMDTFTETRPDDYVARLKASPDEWMTITDDSLPNELERELLTSAAAMCLWQEWMVWYQGEQTSAFTDAFGKIGPVFVRGQAGQWTIVSRLRSILKRLWV
ncbi:MAG: hypothetical protein OXG53_05955 [Chloroflexi bacterium]|nr:hypothetical protein [Chloroflexota bacterium]